MDNLLSFPFYVWETQRTVFSGHRNVLNNCLSTVQISSQNCVQTELFVVVGAPVGKIICQYWSVPVQFFLTLSLWLCGRRLFPQQRPHRERDRFRLSGGDPGKLASCWASNGPIFPSGWCCRGAGPEDGAPKHLWYYCRFNTDLALEQEEHELLYSLHWGSVGLYCYWLLFCYSAISHKDCWLLWESLLNQTGLFHKEGVLLVEAPLV